MTYIGTKLKKEIVVDEIITIHYFEYMKNFRFAGESHDFWEFLYVDKGQVTVQADDRYYELHAGDIVFHKPNEFHAIAATGNTAPNLIVMSFICHSEAMSFFHNKSCTLTASERRLVSQIILEAKQAFSTPMHIPAIEQVKLNEDALFGSQQLVLSFLETFLLLVYREHFGQNSTLQISRIPPSMDTSENSERITQIIQYMEFHICEQLSVTTICEEFCISRSALHALFHKEKKCGPIDYFNAMKIDRAREIIRDGTMNFTEIAYFLSYSSLQYFSKQFKKTTGMSPYEYSSSIKKITQDVSAIPNKKDTVL